MQRVAQGKRAMGTVVVMSGRRADGGLREGTTGRVIGQVWAVAEDGPPALKPLRSGGCDGRAGGRSLQSKADPRVDRVEVAFYRKYTEAMVRRFGKLSMDAGRVPSMMGRELFRGRVTSYRVQSFEDAVIFCHDMEKCLLKLNQAEQRLVKRIALQQYTFGEAAAVLGLSLGNCIRQYGRAVDRLTGLLLERELLQPLGSQKE